jgi:hypothetical protein
LKAAAAGLVLSRCPDDGVAIFFQTDIKVRTLWLLAASCWLLLVHQMQYRICCGKVGLVAAAALVPP